MKVVIQRVLNANVTVAGELISSINQGMLLFVCFEKSDTNLDLKKVIEKITNLRIFEDENGKMNLSIKDIKGEILSISQFTLSWDGKKGNRPSFENSMAPESARLHYGLFNIALKNTAEITVKEGVFGAEMKVGLINDGPVTFHLNF